MGDQIQSALDEGAKSGVFSGAACGVAQLGEPSRFWVSGVTRTDRGGEPVSQATIFDLASLTKVVGTTSIVARLVATDSIRLDAKVTEALADLPWRREWKDITVRDILRHQAGFRAWCNFVQDLGLTTVDVAKPETRKRILERIAKLEPESAPRTTTLYSDLGFIVLGEWIERVTKLTLKALLQREVASALGLPSLSPHPLEVGFSIDEVAATEDIDWRGGVIIGEVHDDNAYVWGPVAGHAGVFANVRDTLRAGVAWLGSYLGTSTYLPVGVAQEFLNLPQGASADTRPLGWDRPTGNPSSGGSRISARSVGHLGYTGTSIWIDLERKAVVVLLTNRVHPTSKNEQIKEFRPRFHDTVWEALDE